MSEPLHLQRIADVDAPWKFRGTVKNADLWQWIGDSSRGGRWLLVASEELYEQFEHVHRLTLHEKGQAVFCMIDNAKEMAELSKDLRMWIDYHGDYDALVAAMTIFERFGGSNG